MKPKIVEISPKKMTGIKMSMTLKNDKTSELWRKFMPRRGEIMNRTDDNYYSIKTFDGSVEFEAFTADTEMTKWAAVEVKDHPGKVIEGMEEFTLAGGKYAVFEYKGPASSFGEIFGYIFGVWLPDSEYQLDKREQFEILKEDYDPHDPNAEEEIWIPIK